MKLRIAKSDENVWKDVHALIDSSFAYMETQVGLRPPVLDLAAEDLRKDAQSQLCLVVESSGTIVGCVFARPSRDFDGAFYLGRLAVDAGHRGAGLARQLVNEVADHATQRGFAALCLDTSARLMVLHATFERLGFRRISNPNAPEDVASFWRDLGNV